VSPQQVHEGAVSVVRCMELAGIPASERDRLEDLTSVYLEAMTPAMLAISDDDRATSAQWTVVGIIAGLKMAVLLQDFL